MAPGTQTTPSLRFALPPTAPLYNRCVLYAPAPTCGEETDCWQALDWFSVDIYHMDGLVEGWVDAHVRGFYQTYM